MTDGKGDQLITQLKFGSGAIKDKFAILVDKAKESLLNKKQKLSPNDLIGLLNLSERMHLADLFKQQHHWKIPSLFDQLCEYWIMRYSVSSLIGIVLN